MKKSIRKRLRELAGIAYERELNRHLGGLQAQFDEWQNGRISGDELSDRIHEFHDGPSRDLYKLHARFKPDWIVARALQNGILRGDEVPVEVRDAIADRIEAARILIEKGEAG